MKSRWRLLGTAVTFFSMAVLLTACRSVSPESENDGPGSGQQAGMGQADTTQMDMVQADSEKQSEDEKYNVFYLSHGGWSNETTIMGTDQNPSPFKHVIDHAIQDGKIQPLIIILPTYNNTSSRDSGNYSLALELTDQFHNELLNDLIPAVESRYSTYAEDTTPEGLAASRDHRGFGGFSMGSVNTWCTFRYCLDYFRYFMPMSGSYSTDGEYMAELVRESGHTWDDFFIFSASGTDDFAYGAFKQQIMAMGNVEDGTFRFADNETDGNLAFLEREGYTHDGNASNEYTYNGLRFFWNKEN